MQKHEGVKARGSLLWSFRNPAHERLLRELINEQDASIFVALSSDVSPRIREFVRRSTTVMGTQIWSELKLYLDDFAAKLRLIGPPAPTWRRAPVVQAARRSALLRDR